MSVKHAPEPWSFVDAPGAGLQIKASLPILPMPGDPRTGQEFTFFNVYDLPDVHLDRRTGKLCATISGEAWVQFSSPDFDAMQKANARRIVAAVNACGGVSTEALESGALLMLRSALEAALEEAQERDEDLGCGCWPEVRAALARVKGTSL